MKRTLFAFASVFLFACNNEASTGQATEKDTTTPDSAITPPIVDSALADRTHVEPTPDTIGPSVNKETHQKEKPHPKVASPRAKLDSVSLRETKKLPISN